MFQQNVGQKIKVIPSGMTYMRQFAPKAVEISSPTDIAGLKLWIDFSDISTLYTDSAKTTPVTSDGDVIGAAADKSGEGNDFIQETTAKKPLYKTGIQNLLSIARFDGTDDWLSKVFVGAIPGIFMFVFQPVTGIANEGRLGSDSGGNNWIVRYLTSHNLNMYAGGNMSSTTNNLQEDSFYVTTEIFNGASSKIRSNGSQIVSGNTGALTIFNGFYLGARNDGTQNAKIDIGIVLHYNTVLGDSDIANLESWANNQWSVY